jgi:catechol 2,3-dioxygenase-like lactoylglutathione lyase family enzyme
MSDIIDHAGLTVTDFDAALKFYSAALGPLGIKPIVNFEHEGNRHAGYGASKPDFWIGTSDKKSGALHISFTAKSRADVDAFYAAGLANGGRDNGAPGIRAHYHPDYYGAFVFDPDGNNIEACCRAPA